MGFSGGEYADEPTRTAPTDPGFMSGPPPPPRGYGESRRPARKIFNTRRLTPEPQALLQAHGPGRRDAAGNGRVARGLLRICQFRKVLTR
jgi:hypothetical protein